MIIIIDEQIIDLWPELWVNCPIKLILTQMLPCMEYFFYSMITN